MTAQQPPAPDGASPGTRTCAVVVTYETDPAELESVIEAVAGQVSEVLIVDNGSGPRTRGAATAIAQRRRDGAGVGARVELLQLGQNRGLPEAYNAAIQFAQQHACAFLLLLDHDSIVEPGAVRKLIVEYGRLHRAAGAGAVEALNVEPTSLPTDDFLAGYFDRHTPPRGADVSEEFLATNSGLLVPLATIAEVGPFDTTFFLDAVDFEFGLRMRSRGRPLFRIGSACIRHRRGNPAEVHLAGARWRLRRVDVPRHYYVGRDCTRLFWRYVRIFPLVGFLLLSMPLREGALIVLFYPRKLPHLRALGIGLLHAATGVRGPFVADSVAGGQPPKAGG